MQRGGRRAAVRGRGPRAQPAARGALAARAPAGRARDVGTLDAIAVAVVRSGEANAQVFQVRDGVLSDRQSFYLDNEAGGDVAEVAEAFILQYYASAMMVPPLLVVQRELGPAPALAEALSERRGGPVEIRAAERGDKRRILELAERNARLALGPGEAALRAPAPAARRGARRPPAGARASTRSRCGSSASTSRR